MKITASWLERQPRPKTRRDVNAEGREGLVVRIHPTGAITFRFRYQRGGKRFWLVLGNYGKEDGISLAEAHTKHNTARRELENGLDPIEEHLRRQHEKEEARRERAGGDTVTRLVEQFVHRKLRAERWDAASATWVRDSRANIKARKRPDEAAALLGYVSSARTAGKRHTTKRKPVANLISELGDLKARDVTRRQLIALLDSIVERGAPVAANRVYALLVQFFTWAAAKDLIPASPMAGVERPGGAERPRQRVLNADEIKTFWTKLDGADMAEATRLGLRLLLITAQRRGELTYAKWSHFDFEAKTWTIPIDLLKTSHSRRMAPEPHIVPLAPLANEYLNKLKALTGDGAYVLPAHADKKKNRPYSERVLSRAVRENADTFGIAHFTPHDLRRTAASFMTKLKIPRLHVEKVLNHSTGDIAEIYDRHDYLPEKRIALETWAAHLAALVDEKTKPVVAATSIR